MDGKIKRALVSVWDKRGLDTFARGLESLGITLISTGGTAKYLKQNGISVKQVSDITGFPELFEGRVKTLHPKIHGGILYRRNNSADVAQAKGAGIESIDLVVANLYPFEQVAGKENVKEEEAIENIDIGGPAMVRAAAKNWQNVAVVVDPADYPEILETIGKNGAIGDKKRRELALKAFARTSSYDAAICRYLSAVSNEDLFPDYLEMRFERAYNLRYGENPSQKAAAYRILGRSSIFDSRIYEGSKALSYNNFLDASSAFSLIREFKDGVATVILKHNNPCGGAEGKTLEESYLRAHASDPESSYGGVIAFSRKLDLATAKAIGTRYIEVVLAPGFEPEALEVLKQKESRRILDVSNLWDMSAERSVEFRYIVGGMLYQGRDPGIYDKGGLKVATKKKPSAEEMEDAYFATKFTKHIKSNAIALAKGRQLVGVGAGQMSRVDSCKIAISKAGRNGFDIKGTVASSDAFLPFRDSIDELAKAGITCVVQPGGSVRDAEVIAAADEYGISMLFTGRRHFKH
ncbi:MAG: bifunctional phosphoribosylaminoimidazolecarboxamide formyltransferase/IMP cyclohydrolase [Candidatus Micrarchaeota archaeon]|nr:bifunctional phosphoribosylaminoimidazolecarboxamide formyltransferase/IMP cyclohydrolase [Candidatus Micrarchaeota archaeon]